MRVALLAFRVWRLHLGEQSRTVVELVEALRSGDGSAEAPLLRALEGPLLRIARRITGDAISAEDAYIEAVVKLLRHLPELESAHAFPTYARRTICTVALDLRARRNERDARQALRDTARMDAGAPSGAPAAVDRLSAGEPDAEQALIESERAERVRQEVARLKEPDRSIVRLFFEQSRTYDQISEMLAIPRRTVFRRAGAARLLLAARLKGLEGDLGA